MLLNRDLVYALGGREPQFCQDFKQFDFNHIDDSPGNQLAKVKVSLITRNAPVLA